MKLFTSSNNSASAKILKLAALGMALLFFAALILVTDPVRLIVKWQLSLQPGTLLFHLWRNPPIEVFIMVYMFNYTNVNAYMSGSEVKLKIKEVGPYVYQEFLENHNVTFNENDTISYMPKRYLKFIRNRSVGDPHTDHIIAPNIPYMGLSTLAADLSTVAALAMGAVTRKLNSKPMLNVPVHDYLWGYEDRLVHLASRFVPSIIDFTSFGLLDRMFNVGENVITIALPSKYASSDGNNRDNVRDYSIDNWNGVHGLAKWDFNDNGNATYCNKLQGVYDGTLFPRNIQENDTLYIYRKTFCRTLPIKYSKPVFYEGIEGIQFSLDENTFNTELNDPNTSCFCKGHKCLKRGLSSVSPCYYNIPLAISFPHFINGDSSLLKPFVGLQPNQTLHGSKIVIQPHLGVPMHIHTRFQANQIIDDIRFNRDLTHFKHMALPLLWVDVCIDKLPDLVVLLLKLLFKILPTAQGILLIILLATGICLVATSLLLCLWHSSFNSAQDDVGRRIIPMLPLLKTQTQTQEKDDATFLPTARTTLVA